MSLASVFLGARIEMKRRPKVTKKDSGKNVPYKISQRLRLSVRRLLFPVVLIVSEDSIPFDKTPWLLSIRAG